MTTPKTYFHLLKEVCLKLIALCVFVLFATASANSQVTMHVINVGQADAILLELPHELILIDAGGENTGNDRDEDHLFAYIDELFNRRTDLNNTIHSVIVSHPHIDHTKFLRDVFENYKVLNFLEGGGVTGSGINTVFATRALADKKHIKTIKVLDNNLQSAPIKFWSNRIKNSSNARLRFLSGFKACNDENNDSLVLRVDYGQKSFLLSGDSEVSDKEGNNNGCQGLIPRLITSYKSTGLLNADVYKVGHHGSRNGTSRELLQAVTPQYAVMSAGHFQTKSPGKFHGWFFGHPSKDAVTLLQEFVSEQRAPKKVFWLDGPQTLINNQTMTKAIYCTCWDGDVKFTIGANGQNITVDTVADVRRMFRLNDSLVMSLNNSDDYY